MSSYSGTDNLEIMAEAVNYNSFLLGLITKYARAADRILDFGAGIGTFAARLQQHRLKVRCVETDSAQAGQIASLGIEVSSSIAQVGTASIDYIYSLNVLEHIEDDGAVMAELYRALTPGGGMLLYLPAFQLLYSSMDRKVGHFRRYTRRRLLELSTHAGFEVVQCRYADSLGFFATLLYKVIGRDDGSIDRRSLVLYDRLAFPVSRLLDMLFGALFGKNVYIVLVKPAS